MLTPNKVLDNYFLETRCMLVEIAATLDRYDRAVEDAGGASGDARLDKLYRSLALLSEKKSEPDRARQILELFSDPV